MGNAVASGLDLGILARAERTAGLADPAAFQALAAELLTDDASFVYVMLPE